MKKVLLIILLGSSVSMSAQTLFPEKCIGVWQGMMHIYNQGIIRDSVKVKFTVAKTAEANAWTWKMEYLSEKMPMVKDYVLKLKDKEKGIYSTDEGGGLELMDYQFGNKLYSVFEVNGVLLTASYEWIDKSNLVFEVTSGKKGESPVKDITNFSVANVQRVVMRKQ
jgi:hypothetical protein